MRERGSHEQVQEVEERKKSTQKLEARKLEATWYLIDISSSLLSLKKTQDSFVRLHFRDSFAAFQNQDDDAPEIPKDAFAGIVGAMDRMVTNAPKPAAAAVEQKNDPDAAKNAQACGVMIPLDTTLLFRHFDCWSHHPFQK